MKIENWPLRHIRGEVRCTRRRCWETVIIGTSMTIGSLTNALTRHIEDRHVEDWEK